MNCRDIESLILAEKDGALTTGQRAALTDHVAACPACRQFRTDLESTLAAYRTEAANITVPDADTAWRDLQSKLHAPAATAKKRPLAPVIWFAAPLAAAAALAFVFFSQSLDPRSQTPDPKFPLEARAEFVETGDTNASTVVYVDNDSGWLVVWADNGDGPHNG